MPLASRVITLCSYKVSFQITIIIIFFLQNIWNELMLKSLR